MNVLIVYNICLVFFKKCIQLWINFDSNLPTVWLKNIPVLKDLFPFDYRKSAYNDVSLTRLRKKVDLTSRKAKNTVKLISPICLPFKPVELNTEGETERGLDSQQVTVTGYITEDPETTGKLHQINPQIQTKKYCNDKSIGSGNMNDIKKQNYDK